MIAGSVRATSARESAYRIAAPNSLPRSIMLVALEAGAARLLASIAKDAWRGTRFRSSVWLEDAPDPRGEALDQWCDIIAGHAGSRRRASSCRRPGPRPRRFRRA
jgi:hypothetical protein